MIIPLAFGGLDNGVFMDKFKNRITATAEPSIGGVDCVVVPDTGADLGFYVLGRLATSVTAISLTIVAMLDGAPGASDVFGWGVAKRAAADNETPDAALDTAVLAQKTIGSSGDNYANEDWCEITITLTPADFANGDNFLAYVFRDDSVTTYAGDPLIPPYGVFLTVTP